jgi:hypothetical protein
MRRAGSLDDDWGPKLGGRKTSEREGHRKAQLHHIVAMAFKEKVALRCRRLVCIDARPTGSIVFP